jgi:hypothetical protein
MHRWSRSAPLVCALLLALGACAGDGDDADVAEGVSDQLVETTDLTREQADCFAEALVDELGEDTVKDIDFSADEPEGELGGEIVAATDSASTKCEIDLGSVGG